MHQYIREEFGKGYKNIFGLGNTCQGECVHADAAWLGLVQRILNIYQIR